jgi:hypothetical protein
MKFSGDGDSNFQVNKQRKRLKIKALKLDREAYYKDTEEGSFIDPSITSAVKQDNR